MTSQDFLDNAAIQIAATERDRYDFTSPEHFNLFAERTWKLAQALADKRKAPESENLSAEIAELKKEIASMATTTTVSTDATVVAKEVAS